MAPLLQSSIQRRTNIYFWAISMPGSYTVTGSRWRLCCTHIICMESILWFKLWLSLRVRVSVFVMSKRDKTGTSTLLPLMVLHWGLKLYPSGMHAHPRCQSGAWWQFQWAFACSWSQQLPGSNLWKITTAHHKRPKALHSSTGVQQTCSHEIHIDSSSFGDGRPLHLLALGTGRNSMPLPSQVLPMQEIQHEALCA